MHPARNHVSSRQYPRIPLDSPGQLEVLTHLRKQCNWESIAVSIRTASCEGVGVVLHRPTPELLLRRDKIQISLRVGDSSMRLPGHIVWNNQGKEGELDLGIKLDLAFARAADRQIYSTWVVAQILNCRDSMTQP